MKKYISLLLALALALSLAACGGNDSGSGGSGSGDTQTSAPSGGDSGNAAEPSGSGAAATAGVCWYNFADTFISSARQTLEGIAAADGTISVSCADSQGAVETQTSNMNNFFTQDVKYLVLKEPLKKAHIKRHEGKGRRNRPEFSQFLRPNAGFCPVF